MNDPLFDIYRGPFERYKDDLCLLYLAGVRGKVKGVGYEVIASLNSDDSLNLDYNPMQADVLIRDYISISVNTQGELSDLDVIPFTFDIFAQLPKFKDIFTYHGISQSRLWRIEPSYLLYQLIDTWLDLQLIKIEGAKGRAQREFMEHVNVGDDVIEAVADKFKLNLITHNTVVVLRSLEAILRYAYEYGIVIMAKDADEISLLSLDDENEVENRTIIGDYAFISIEGDHYEAAGHDVSSAFNEPRSSLYRIRVINRYVTKSFANWAKRIQNLIDQGYLGFIGDYITDWSYDLDDVEMTATKIEGVLNKEQIKTTPLIKALNPAYSLYMPRQSQHPEFTEQVKSKNQLEIEQLCNQSQLNPKQIEYLKQTATQMDIYSGGPISKTKLCQLILNQFELERGERQKMKALANFK
jgi:hypothetical protein